MKPSENHVDYKNARYSLTELMSNLSENGFDVHNVGGVYDSDFECGDVYRFLNGQNQLLGKTGSILTCNANVFMQTLFDVEAQFNYQLFG